MGTVNYVAIDFFMIFLFISSKQKTTIQTIKINSWYWIVTM